MIEENKMLPELTAYLKKKLQLQFTLVFQDELYEIAKSPKSRFSSTLKDEIVKALNPKKIIVV
jgi:hypothetical protein